MRNIEEKLGVVLRGGLRVERKTPRKTFAPYAETVSFFTLRRPGFFKTHGLVISVCGLKWPDPGSHLLSAISQGSE